MPHRNWRNRISTLKSLTRGTIVPLDKDTIFESVEKTGRLITVEEGRMRGGLGAEIAALACGEYFSALKAPVQRVAAPMVSGSGQSSAGRPLSSE